MTAVTTFDTALTRLRDHLARRGITVADNAVTMIGEYGRLRLTDRLEVWCGPEWYRWAAAGRGWRFAPVADPDNAARQVAETLAANRAALAAWFPGWSFWRSDAGRWWATRDRLLTDTRIDSGLSHTVDADDLDQLLTCLLRQEELARTLS